MLAVVKTSQGPGNVHLMDVPEPAVLPGTLKIRVRACGVCGTDVHIMHDRYPYSPPVILGHELSGEVVEAGEGVCGIKVGDRVTVESHASICGHCYYCKQSMEKLCTQRKALGRAADGGMAEYLVIRADMVHRLPDNVDYSSGALTQLVACAYHTVSERTNIRAGDIAVIFGPGATGQLVAQVAKAEGAKVIVCGTTRSKPRLELARKLGADIVIDTQTEDVAGIIQEITGGLGADVVFECSGAPQAIEDGLNVVRKGGKFSQMGFVGKAIPINWDKLIHKDLVLRGVPGYAWSSWEGALRLVSSGQVSMSELIGMELPLQEWEDAFRLSEERKAIRIILKP